MLGSGGADPLADGSLDRFTPLADELAHPHPHRSENAYPYAHDHIAQLFDHPAAPDLCVLHSAAHNWEDQGGHLGEHGSLGIVQARAPLVLAGKGVPPRRLRPAVGPSRRRGADRRLAPGLPARRRRRAPRRPGRHRARRRARCRRRAPAPRRDVPVRRHQRQRPLRHGAPGRRAQRRAPRRHGHRLRAGRDGGPADHHPGQPHVGPDRSPPGPPRDPAQRVVRPPDRRADHHELERHLAVGDAAPRARGRVDPHGRCAAPSRTPSPRRSTNRAISAPDTRRSTSSVAATSRRCPKIAGRARPHDRALRPPLQGLPLVVGRRPHGHRPGRRDLGRRVQGRVVPASTLHVLQLHAHRRRDARRWSVLRGRGRVDPRLRRSRRRDPGGGRTRRRASTTPRSCSSPTTGWSRTTRPCSGDWDVAAPRRGPDVPRRGLRLPLPRRARVRRNRPRRGTDPAAARGGTPGRGPGTG